MSRQSRRHFLKHLAACSAMAAPATIFTNTLRANAADLARNHKSAILLWMGGGPSTIDIWDLKPGAATGGPFRPIATSGNEQICEHLPLLAQQMHHLSIVRSMSTSEADHDRGRYYMHTGYVPNPNIQHPSYGAVVSREMESHLDKLDVPPFVAVGGASEGPGFLGMTYAPFVVNSQGRVANLDSRIPQDQLQRRMQVLASLERGFIAQRRGRGAEDHAKMLDKTVALMTSEQMKAFRVDSEPEAVRERYGESNFGRGCLMARRLVEQGVPFIEVDLGGWDNHQGVFDTLQNNLLPTLDQGMSALVEDLDQRGLLESTAILWMGEFGRTPRINADVGRDHWARSWSVVVGGAGITGGTAIGATNGEGTAVAEGSSAYSSQDLMATVLKSLDVPLDRTYKSLSGRPMRIANSGRPIDGLVA